MLGQVAVPVLPGDTPDSLAARVLVEEHKLYPRTVRQFVEGRVSIDNGVVRINEN